MSASLRRIVPTQESSQAPTNAPMIGHVMTVETKLGSPVSKRRVRAEDLKSMKEEDSFLYYSIPSVRTAEMLGRDIDASKLETASNDTGESFSVTRRKQISFECHPCKFMEEFLSEDSEDIDDLADDELLDMFFGRSM